MSIDRLFGDVRKQDEKKESGYYPYQVIKKIDAPMEHKYALMFIHELDMRFPKYNMYSVRTILERCTSDSYKRSVRDVSIIYLMPDNVRERIFNDTAFRDEMIHLYEQKVRPEIRGYRI